VATLWYRYGFLIRALNPVVVTYGYRPSECGVRLLTETPDPTFKVTKIRPEFYENGNRRPARMSLGCHVVGAALPVPDLNHGPSQLAGCVKRVATHMPVGNRATFRRFFKWVKSYVRKNWKFLQFEREEEFHFDEWLRNAPYSQARKDQLQKAYDHGTVNQVNELVKAFAKDEPYMEYKHLRGIYSRSDDYKVRVGPFFKKFGDRLFSHPDFIKKIPMSKRAQALKDRLVGDHVFCTDFSQYEATFVRRLMKVQNWIYSFSLERHPLHNHFMDLFSVLEGTNRIIFKTFDIEVQAKRMSGEMDTSCSNGMMNDLITRFNLHEAGNRQEEIQCYFEGDDGIITCKYLPTAAQYTALGANIKIETPESLATASFCGMLFHPDVMHMVKDPRKALLSFGWTSVQYLQTKQQVLNKLLKAKSLSLLHEVPGCPILRSLALYGNRVSGTYSKQEMIDFVSKQTRRQYDREYFLEQLNDEDDIFSYEIHPKTRALFEQLFDIPVSKQIEIEKYLDGLNELQPLEIDLQFHRHHYDYFSRYSVTLPDRLEKRPAAEFSMLGFSTPAYLNPNLLQIFQH
jgi:hypothetical protein